MGNNPNYVKFGPTETVVAFVTDRGELKTNQTGDYFFRAMVDRRFACVSPDLERQIIDLRYRANERIGITRTTRNRMVIWKVRRMDAPAATGSEEAARPVAAAAIPSPAPTPCPAAIEPRHATNARRAIAAPSSIPASKYAPPPVAWPEMIEVVPAKPTARALESHGVSSASPTPAAGLDQVTATLQECMYRAVEVAKRTQLRATELGFPITFSAGDVQDLASTLHIQMSKQANMDRIDRDRAARASGDSDAWRHRR